MTGVLYGPGYGYGGGVYTSVGESLGSLQRQLDTLTGNAAAAVAAEASTRATADTTEAATRATADTTEATTRAAADTLRTLLADGPLELSLSSGMAGTPAGQSLLGVLNGDLYCAGSCNPAAGYDTGALAGLSRWRPDTGWVSYGKPPSVLSAALIGDFNGHAEWGMVAYKGSLYVGDRHLGILHRWTLNADGSMADLVNAATIGGEDVFPGPVWNGYLWCGTFGVTVAPTKNPELWRYDGTTAVRVIDFTGCGVGGQVLSVVPHGQSLYVTVIGAGINPCQMWRVDRDLTATMVWSQATPIISRWLVSDGLNLYSLKVTYETGFDGASWDVWSGTAWVAVSPGLYLGSLANTRGGLTIGSSLLSLSLTSGITEYDNGQTTNWTPMPGAGPYPFSAKVHDHYLWLTAMYPPGVWRRRLGLGRSLRSLGAPQRVR